MSPDRPRTGGGSATVTRLTLRGWRWATDQGYRIPCELHGVKACTICMDPERVRGALEAEGNPDA